MNGECGYLLTVVFQHCSSLVKSSLTVDALADKWKAFKHNKPVRGAILLNKDLTKVFNYYCYYGYCI